MPLLPLDPLLSPADLLGPLESLGVLGGAWWVLHTRPRAEKSVARQLFRRRLPFFLPLYPREGWSRGRLLRSYLPLFTGYVFLRGDREARLEALQTNLVARVLPVQDHEQLHKDLMQVHELIRSGLPMRPEDRLEPGRPVEIIAGPLAGLQGRLLRRCNQGRFLIEVQFLQRGVSVDIENWMIQALTESPSPWSAMAQCG